MKLEKIKKLEKLKKLKKLGVNLMSSHPEWKKEFWRVVRFGITGTLSTLLHYAAYLLALLFVSATPAYTIGYGVGLCFNYVMTTRFTFREAPTRRNAAGFVLSHVLNYLLEIGVLNVFLLASVEERLAGILTLIVVVPINFLLLRYVFVNKKTPPSSHEESIETH